jgi:Ca-activated chloride channel family protein
MFLAGSGILWLTVGGLLAAATVLLYRHHRTGLSRGRVVAIVTFRILLIACLVLAIAQPILSTRPPHTFEVTVVDVSRSLTDRDLADIEARLRQAGALLPGGSDQTRFRRMVVFDHAARLIDPRSLDMSPGWLSRLRGPGQVLATSPASMAVDGGSVLADALNLAAATVPDGVPGRIVVFTDGLATGGDAMTAATRIARRGLRLDVQPCGSAREDEVVVTAAGLPAEASVGATVPLRVAIEAGRPGPATLAIVPDAEPDHAMQVPLSLQRGRQEHVIAVQLDRPGCRRFRARCEAGWDTETKNNERTAAVFVSPAYQASVVEADPAQPATNALARLLGPAASVTRVPPENLAQALSGLERTNLLVIADTPAGRIPRNVQREIRDAITRGLGVLFVGGRQSFGPGGYQGTDLGRTIPVEFEQQIERRDPSVTLVIIIDTSGSMKGPRVALAKEVARLAMRRLQPHDKVGIVEFYGTKRWAARIQSAANAIDINRALNRLSAGGGTVILPAIEEAHYALLNVHTRTKHVLIITDGGVETGPFQAIITRMADAGITASTVMVGPGPYSTFLSSLAHWGKGRFYAAPDRFNLPEIILKQPESLPASPFVEQASRITGAVDDSVLANIDFGTAPPINGYVRTRPCPTADILLRSDRGDPILARWRYGRGFVAALTTDLGGAWSEALTKWPACAKMLSNLARQIASASPDRGLRIEPVLRPMAIEARIEYVADETPVPIAPIDLVVTSPTGTTQQWTLDPIQPGRWNHLMSVDAAGTYELHAETRDGRVNGSAAVAVPAAREVSAVAPAQEFLAGLQRMASTTAAPSSGAPAASYIELWPWLVLAAMCLVLLNVLVRRWPLRTHRAESLVVLALLLALPGAGRAETPPRATRAPVARTRPAPLPRRPTTNRPTSRPTATRRTASSRAAAPLGPAQREQLREAEKLIAAAFAGDSFNAARELVARAAQRLAENGLDATDVLVRAEKNRGTSPTCTRLRAYLAGRRGDLKAARQILDDAVASGQDDTSVWADLGRYLELLGEDALATRALEHAAAKTADPRQAFAIQIRRVGLLFDSGRRETAQRVLRESAGHMNDPAAVRSCGYLAGLYDEPALADTLIQPDADPGKAAREWLLKGLFALRASRWDEATACFERAAGSLPLQRERQFAVQQLLSVARQHGDLNALADRWLKDSELPADRLYPLLNLLHELGRVDDALSLLDRGSVSPAHRIVIEDPQFQEEVVATAVEAGRLESAERTFLALIRQSGTDLKWRVSLARLRLSQGRRDEAASLLRDVLPSTHEVEDLFRLADAAKQLALDDVALDAVAKAAKVGPSGEFRAGLWRAELAEKRGDVSAASVELERIVPVAANDPAMTRQLADAFERYGRTKQAIDLLRRLVEQTGDEDAQLRLAWLLEQDQQLNQARELWRSMWVGGTTPARKREAAARLLDLSAKTGTLADLAIQLEEKLGRGQADAAELGLLVDLYTQVGDAVSTSEVLFTFAEKSGDEIGALRQLAHAYLRMGQLAQTDATLRRLLELDPAHATDYLQELMVLAVERQRVDDAEAAIERLAKSEGNDSTIEELSAGVFSMLGEHERAAQLYDRVLARYPDRVEVWLLWANAMRSAGRAGEAIARLQFLAEEAEPDDLFLVAVDGLLNLDAGRAPLQSALRRIWERIAASPDKIFLYDVAADLMDAVGQADHINDRMEQAVVFAGEQRGALLREMMERAKADGRTDRLIAYGNSLIALGYNVPPQAFLDLGEALLAERHVAEAERAFGRACSLGDYATVRQKVADAYERALLPQPAQRIIAELLITDPDNVALLHRNASLLEQLDRFEDSFAQYQRALEVLIGRIPRVHEGKAAPLAAGTATPRRQRIAANIDEMTQFFEPTIDGLLASARTDKLRTALIELLRRMTQQELAAPPDGKENRKTLDRFPRLARLVATLRFVTFSLHRPEVADDVDRALRKRFPTDASLASVVVQERLSWGLFDQATAFIDPSADIASMPAELAVGRLLGDPALLQKTLAGESIDPALAGRLVPALIMLGRDREARQAIETCETRWTNTPVDAARGMMIACLAVNDPDRLQRWLGRYVDACRTIPDGERLAEAVTDGVRLSWNVIAPAQRQGLLNRLERLATAFNPRSGTVDLLRLQLAGELGVPAEDRARVLGTAARELAARPAKFVDVLRWVTASERPPTLEQAWTACKPSERLDLLLTVAGDLTQDAGQDLQTAFRRLLESSPAIRLDRHSPYSELVRDRWHRNDVQPALGLLVADHLLRQLPNEPAVQVAAASAYDAAGDRTQATALARRAIDALFAERKLDSEQELMIEDIARVLSRSELDSILRSVRDAQRAGKAAMIELFAAGVMLARLEREEEAVAMFSEAFRLGATNPVPRQQLIGYLDTTGRWRQLTTELERYLPDRSVVQDYELSRLAEAHRLLYDPFGALRVLAYDSGPLGAIRTVQLETMLGREDRVKAILQRYLVKNRLERRFYAPLAARAPLPGGMQEYLIRQRPEFTRQPSLFTLLAPLDCAAAEFDAMWQSAPPDRRDLPGLIEARIAAAAARNRLDAMAGDLAAHLRDSTFNLRDLRLLTAMVTDHDISLPKDTVGSLGRRLAWVEPDQMETLEAWARLYLRTGERDSAAAILRWVTAFDLAQSRRSTDAVARFRRLDLYLASLPEAKRNEESRRILGASTINPIEPPADRLDATVLQRLVDTGEAELTRSALSGLGAWNARLGASTFLPRVHRACAYTEAIRGNSDALGEHVTQLIRLFASTYGDWNPLDPMQCLPAASRLKEPGKAADLIERFVRRAVEAGSLSRTHATHTLALLGQWCVQNKLTDKARELLAEARSFAGDRPSERWLWVMDLARQVEPGSGLQLAEAMLAAGQLPIPRVAAALDEVQRAKGRQAADELALKVAEYSDYPTVLERAIRGVRTSGDSDMSRRLEARLRAITGRPPHRPAPSAASRPTSSRAASSESPGPR